MMLKRMVVILCVFAVFTSIKVWGFEDFLVKNYSPLSGGRDSLGKVSLQNENGNVLVTWVWNGKITARDMSGSDSVYVSDTYNAKTDPDVYGNTIVWSDKRNGNWDIYGYDWTGKNEFQIASGAISQVMPVTNGNIVVWNEDATGNGYPVDVWGYDLSTSNKFKITTNNFSSQYAAVSGNTMLLLDDRNNSLNIYGYNLDRLNEFQITNYTNYDSYPSFPAISGNTAAWFDNRNGTWDIFAYDLSQQVEFLVERTGNTDMESLPCLAISGNLVVWEDNRNGNLDIYGYDLSKRLSDPENAEFQITSNPFDEYAPDVDGHVVVYETAQPAFNTQGQPLGEIVGISGTIISVPELSTFWQLMLAGGVLGLIYLWSYSKRLAQKNKHSGVVKG